MSSHFSRREPGSARRHDTPARSSRRQSSSPRQHGGGCGGQDPFRPVARTAADVLAIIAHTLGFWPQDSVAILTTTSDSVGPCLRVDLPHAQELKDPEFLASWTMHMAGLLEYDTVGSSMFVAVYTSDSSSAERDWPTREEAQHVAQHVVRAMDEAGALSGHDLWDAWCLQGSEWWSVDLPSARADVAQIRTSAIYAALVCDGSVVEADPAADTAGNAGEPEWAATFRGRRADDAAVQAVQDMEKCPLTDYAWRTGYLHRWNQVLTSFQDGLPLTPGDSQELTELMLCCVDPRGLDLLLAMVLTGEVELSHQAWEQWQEDPLVADNHALLHVARVILGEWEGTPDWSTVDRCDLILDRLIALVASISDVAGGNPLATVEASLWLARGHLERFRARGSRTQQYLTRAQALAPWHPGIERLRQLCAVSPVPRWATHRATAWRRRST